MNHEYTTIYHYMVYNLLLCIVYQLDGKVCGKPGSMYDIRIIDGGSEMQAKVQLVVNQG